MVTSSSWLIFGLEPTGVAGPNMVLIVPGLTLEPAGVAGPKMVLMVPLYLSRTGDLDYLALE